MTICTKIRQCKQEVNFAKRTLKDPKGGGSSFKIENKSKSTYQIIDIESCVYENIDNQKCDYALETDTTIYFIELKGSNLEKGCNQLKETISNTKKCFTNKDIKACLVVSKVNAPKTYKNTPNYKQLARIVGNPNRIEISSQIHTQII